MDTPRGVHRISARDYKVRASYAMKTPRQLAERGPRGYAQGRSQDFSQGLLGPGILRHQTTTAASRERGPRGYHQGRPQDFSQGYQRRAGFPIKSSLKDFSQGLAKNGEPHVTKLLISKETKLKDGEIDCFLVQE